MNLVRTSEVARKAVVIFIAVVVGYFVFLIVKPIAISGFKALFPPKDLPNPIYGRLDSITFEPKRILNNTPQYVLNTKTGALPGGFDNKMPVYTYKAVPFSYQAGQDAQDDASFIGYTDENLASDLKGDVYVWRDLQFGGQLEIFINDGRLTHTTPLVGKNSKFSTGKLTEREAVNVAKNLFQKINRFSEHYSSGENTAVLGKFAGNSVVTANSQPEAQIARVDFFRSIFKIPILGPDAKKGLLHAFVRLVGTESPTLNYPVIEAYKWDVEPETQATYPIISVQTAWNAVSTNKGVISNVTPRGSSPFTNYKPVRVDRVLINDIYLAYYDSPELQKYMQPIYVFDGNYTSSDGSAGKVIVYYPAISPEYLKIQPSIPVESQE